MPRTERLFAIVLMTVSMSAVLARAGQIDAQPGNTPESVRKYWLTPAPAVSGVVERGEWVFRQKGCFLCHGPAGQGGVPNRNYVKDTVPRLAPATLMKLAEPEHVLMVLEHLKRGLSLDSLPDAEAIPRFNLVLAQYHAIHQLIQTGRAPDKKDGKGPTPPLAMPSWHRELSSADIDAIIAYLLDTRYRETLSAAGGESLHSDP